MSVRLDDNARAVLAVMRSHAERMPRYRPENGDPPPGDGMRVLIMGTLWVVYSITELPDGTFRHLSVSLDQSPLHPEAGDMLRVAHALGFDFLLPYLLSPHYYDRGVAVMLQPACDRCLVPLAWDPALPLHPSRCSACRGLPLGAGTA